MKFRAISEKNNNTFISLIEKQIVLYGIQTCLSYTIQMHITTTQLAIQQYTTMKHLKISCQKHHVDSLVLSSRCMTNYILFSMIK